MEVYYRGEPIAFTKLKDRRPLLPVIALASAASLWETAFFFGKIALREMNVSQDVALRFIFGSLALSPALLSRRASLRAKHWRVVSLAAVVGVPVQF
jgi:hypothetical protein